MSEEVDAAPEIGVRNSQPEGIGHVAVLGELVCWNNLGRNVVFADPRLRPQAVFGSTVYPGQDEPSQYDLDVHAVLDVPELGALVVLNHLGLVRAFRSTDLLGRSGVRQVEPTGWWSFSADVERTVAVDGRLVGSGPRSEGVDGLLVSGSLTEHRTGGELSTNVYGQAFGQVTALSLVPSGRDALIAIGGDGRLALAPLKGGRLGRAEWEIDIGFRVACIASHDDALWAAGPDRAGAVDDYDWERLGDGRFAVIDPADGTLLVTGSLPDDVAWGTGGVAVVPVGRLLAAAGRDGALHLIDPWTPTNDRSTAPLTPASLGIAHAAVLGTRVVFGFNRGGYRLYSADPAL